MQAFSPKPGRLRSNRVRKIARGRAANDIEPETRCAFARATATTRSLNESVGKQTASFLTYRLVEPRRSPQVLRLDQRREANGQIGLKALGDWAAAQR